MSDNRLLFVPLDVDFRPSRDAADRAVLLLKSIIPNANEVEAVFYDDVQFHSGMGNWSGVKCPACAADLEDWFFSCMKAIWQEPRKILRGHTPCCGTSVSLNDLAFVWPAGFSRFAIEAMNPGIRDTTLAADQELACCLGSACRKIWEHI